MLYKGSSGYRNTGTLDSAFEDAYGVGTRKIPPKGLALQTELKLSGKEQKQIKRVSSPLISPCNY